MHSNLRRIATFVLLCLVVAPAYVQTPRGGGTQSRPARAARTPQSRPWHWTAFPPNEGVPCPSHVAVPTCPPELLLGMHALDRSVHAVVDGDTIHVEGLKGSLRFIGVDAEETFKEEAKLKLALTNYEEYVRTEYAGHDALHPPKYATPMGEAAKDFVEKLLADVKDVRLEYDEPERKLDIFGRHLVLILVPNRGPKNDTWVNLNVELVRQGLSPYFDKYGRSERRHAAFVAAAAEARAAGRGIWGPTKPIDHYRDYPARQVWWTERADAIAQAGALRAQHGDVVILGRPSDWKRLEALVGKTAHVFGAPGAFRLAGGTGLQIFDHVKGEDFIVAGPVDDVKKLGFAAQTGNLLWLTGTVELYRGKPQFHLGASTPITVSRRAPFATPAAGVPESAPASRAAG